METNYVCTSFTSQELEILDTAFNNKEILLQVNEKAKGLDEFYYVLRRMYYSNIPELVRNRQVFANLYTSFSGFKFEDSILATLSYSDLYNWYRDNEMNLSDKDSLICLKFFEGTIKDDKNLLSEIIESGIEDEFTVRKAYILSSMCIRERSQDSSVQIDLLVKGNEGYIHFNNNLVRFMVNFDIICPYTSFTKGYEMLSVMLNDCVHFIVYKGKLFTRSTDLEVLEFSKRSINRLNILGDYKHITLFD